MERGHATPIVTALRHESELQLLLKICHIRKMQKVSCHDGPYLPVQNLVLNLVTVWIHMNVCPWFSKAIPN